MLELRSQEDLNSVAGTMATLLLSMYFSIMAAIQSRFVVNITRSEICFTKYSLIVSCVCMQVNALLTRIPLNTKLENMVFTMSRAWSDFQPYLL